VTGNQTEKDKIYSAKLIFFKRSRSSSCTAVCGVRKKKVWLSMFCFLYPVWHYWSRKNKHTKYPTGYTI